MMVLAQAGAYSPEAGRPGGVALPFDVETGRDRLGGLEALEGLGPDRDGGGARRGAAPDEARSSSTPGRATSTTWISGARIFVRAAARARASPASTRSSTTATAERRTATTSRSPSWRRRSAPRRRAEAPCAPAIASPSPASTSTTTAPASATSGAHARPRRGRAARRARRRRRRARLAPRAPRPGRGSTTIEAPSPARRPPACPAFGACGGCVLQHLAYDAQLAWKRDRVARALGAHPALGDVTVDACVASPRPLGYRNRSKLVARARRGGRGSCSGAYAPRSHDVVDLAGCRIAEPPLDETAAALRALLDEAGVARLRRADADRRPAPRRAARESRRRACWPSGSSRRPLPDGVALARRFRAARPEVIGVVEHVNRCARQRDLLGRGGRQRTSPRRRRRDRRSDRRRGTPRAPAARRPARSSRRTATWPPSPTPQSPTRWRSRPTERVVDAYCGVGGIALTLARSAAEVIGIESHAGRRRRRHGVGRAQRRRQRPLRRRRRRAARSRQIDRADVVVLNPPRKGCAPERARRGRPPRPARHRLSLLRSRHAGPRSGPARRRAATAPAPSRRSTCSPTRRTSRHSPSSKIRDKLIRRQGQLEGPVTN